MVTGGIQFVKDMIPEFTIILLALVVLVICLYSFIKHRDLPGAGYIIPLVYIIGIYTYFSIGNPTHFVGEFFTRLAFIMLLTDIAIWRIVGIIANRSKNGTGEKPITLKETKLALKNLLNKIFKRGS